MQEKLLIKKNYIAMMRRIHWADWKILQILHTSDVIHWNILKKEDNISSELTVSALEMDTWKIAIWESGNNEIRLGDLSEWVSEWNTFLFVTNVWKRWRKEFRFKKKIKLKEA